MKQFLTVFAILAMVVPAMGAVSDNFNGGFQLGGAPYGWNWVADGTYSATTVNVGVGDDELLITSTFPPVGSGGTGSNFVGGVVGLTASYTNTFVTATVNTNSPNSGNDMGLLARANTTTFELYGLNYDSYLNNIELVYNAPGGLSPVDLNGADLGATGTGQTVILKMNVTDSGGPGSPVYLVGQAWSADGLTLLGECQYIADGIKQEEGVTIAIISGGPTGVYGALNTNFGGTYPPPINAQMDDWLAQTGLPGDFNLDGYVDVTDLGIMAGNYGTTSGMMWSNGDANLDNAVDVSDLGILAGNYGSSAAGAAAAVPEPSMLCLLGLGSLAMMLLRRR
ncbi:MAG: PEP-CTERM sorting domain-containing protein [Pirellulales bacterium]|nr:PEP-CTERM sorting domain-containing protein [Pirellulales bacterium]